MTTILLDLLEGLGLLMLGGSLGALAVCLFMAGDDDAEDFTETDRE